MSSLHAHWRGRRATVMGLGLFGGGVETARYLARLGMRVTVTDQRPADKLRESIQALDGLAIRFELGSHRESDFTDTDLVVANPAVAPGSPFLAAARRAAVPITSEIELFLEAVRARVVLVTGTQGKSSTSHAIDHFLRSAGFSSQVGGNIGRSLLGSLDRLERDDWVVLEISSYQLEAMTPPAADGVHALATKVAAVCCTNVLADHLERHGTVEAYEAAKRRILEFATLSTIVMLSADDPRTSRWRPPLGRTIFFTTAGALDVRVRLRGGEFRLDDECLGRASDLALPGAFQQDNTLAALATARALGADPKKLAAGVATLLGLEHRLQDLGLRGGHRVWDNGVSTTPDSTIAALRSRHRPLVLLCGGQPKAGLPLDALIEEARADLRCMVGFGAAAETFRAGFAAADLPAVAVVTLEDAVREAFARALPGDEILFSPACASFDQYRNFRDRALAFRAALPPLDPSSQASPPPFPVAQGRFQDQAVERSVTGPGSDR
ncbi:MAG TPA: UDP-N-acetylmuramoyl-L-alanine--D-glutamate ligase [Planctomycetota bacterium]|nr:UDP-N-acetylmuramoyl-L-alanine--D-glutamate ligase [Planctomycetota bacterium]